MFSLYEVFIVCKQLLEMISKCMHILDEDKSKHKVLVVIKNKYLHML